LLTLGAAGAGLQDETVRSVAGGLARAVQKDPGNGRVLENLTALFDYLGDTVRSALARQLADRYR
jgi:hypothetical protein